jgi:hypothetical protein
MASRKRLILGPALLFALAILHADAQGPTAAYRLRILGVFDEATGDPIEGVRVLDLASGNFVQTTNTGTASLLFLPEGGSLIRLNKLGYQPQTVPVSISPHDTMPLTLVLRRVTELPRVVTTDAASHSISPGLRGFEQRRKIESAYFITEPELRKAEGRLLANLLMSKMPGVHIRAGALNASYLMASSRCAGGGPPQVYLDGVALAALTPTPSPSARAGSNGTTRADATVAPFNLDEFKISELAAVEYYPDNNVAPIEFEHTSLRCGALLLWTRER